VQEKFRDIYGWRAHTNTHTYIYIYLYVNGRNYAVACQSNYGWRALICMVLPPFQQTNSKVEDDIPCCHYLLYVFILEVSAIVPSRKFELYCLEVKGVMKYKGI